MNALMSVQQARRNLITYLNNERANLANRSVNDAGAISLIEHTRKIIAVMEFLKIITQPENETLTNAFVESMASNASLSLPEMTHGVIHDFDLESTDAKVLKKWWRARLSATATKLLVEYNHSSDISRKHDMLDIVAAGMKVGELTGVYSKTERMQIALYVNKERQKLTGG